MAKRKSKINIRPFDDIIIIGVSTSLFDYKLAWHINKSMNLSLTKYDDITPDSENFYSFYYYDEGENANVFNLVALSTDERRWVTFSPMTDYLLIIRNYITEERLSDLLGSLNLIPNVTHAYIINIDANKKIDTILENIEFHELNIVNNLNKDEGEQASD